MTAALPAGMLLSVLIVGAAAALVRALALLHGEVRLLRRTLPFQRSRRTDDGAPASGPLQHRPPGDWQARLRHLLVSADPAAPDALSVDASVLLGPRLPLVVAGAHLLVLLILLAAGMPFPAALLLAPPVVVAGMRGGTGWRAERWRARFRAQLPDAIALMVRGIRAGSPVAEAVADVGHDMPAPLGRAFSAAHDSVRLGQPLEGALWDIARRVRAPEMDFLCVTISVQRETGGNLSETLNELEMMVRKRQALGQKAKALSSEARASALIIGALPVVMGTALFLMAPDYMAPLTSTLAGRLILGAAVGSLMLGAATMILLVRREA